MALIVIDSVLPVVEEWQFKWGIDASVCAVNAIC